MSTIVDRLHDDFKALVVVLAEGGELSLLNVAEEHFRKSELLAAASYFERSVVEQVESFVKVASGDSALVLSFVQRKGLKRQYHTLFDWDSNNANHFFKLFGDVFKSFMAARCSEDEALRDGVKAFMELGRERNRLVHQDYAAYTLEKTADEIFELYLRGKYFVDQIDECLTDCNNVDNDGVAA